MTDFSYDNDKDLLNFIFDICEVNRKADFNDDKVWKSEFQFIYDEIQNHRERSAK